MPAAGLDLVLGDWRQPRWFHALLRFGERCEQRINPWGVSSASATGASADVDSVMRNIEALVRDEDRTRWRRGEVSGSAAVSDGSTLI